MKIIYFVITIILCIGLAQEVAPEVTMERKKLIILSSENKDSDISKKITQIASSTATQLNRYDVMDRSQLDRILNEQKLQHSGVVNPDQAIEIGKVAGANEALFISITNFGQKGVPTEKQEEKDEEEEPETGLFGWIVKEVVKAEIDKEMENVERYPNNIHTVIDGEVRLINVETGESEASFSIHADHTGGVKAKSLSEALKQVRSQMYTNLKTLYKLSSEILDVRGGDVTLLLGKNMGVKPGTLFEIITREEKRVVRDREITIPGKSVGFVEVQTMSMDASEGRVLRKWDDIEPGYQAQEITGGIFAGGISGIYGSGNRNMRLRVFGNYKPFHRFGWTGYIDIGTVTSYREYASNSDLEEQNFQFGLGVDLNYRLIRTSPFSLGGILSFPFDFHSRSDDGLYGNENNEVHTVILPVFSPRVGIQSEIMVSPSLDLVFRGEYVLLSKNLDNKWTYSDDDEESSSLSAHWDSRGEPKIKYSGFQFSIGIRSVFIN